MATAVFEKRSCVREYHVYKDEWTAAIGESYLTYFPRFCTCPPSLSRACTFRFACLIALEFKSSANGPVGDAWKPIEALDVLQD